MASNPIYQFYAELDEFEPKIWRRFQVTNNITVARLGYIVQVLFEMTASHLMAIEVPEGENFRAQMREKHSDWADDEECQDMYRRVCRYEIMNEAYDPCDLPEGDVREKDAAKVRIRHAVYELGDRLKVNYDFGDDWWVSLTLEKVFEDKELPGAELPRVLEGEGFGIVEDVGGPGRLEDLVQAFQGKKGARHRELRKWMGTETFDITAFDLDDMNFRLKKIPRIYKQCYEDMLEPTQPSIDLIERKYQKRPIK